MDYDTWKMTDLRAEQKAELDWKLEMGCCFSGEDFHEELLIDEQG